MALELQQLRHVLALARHGTFVRAAMALHISQPALSRSVQGLERNLGAALFQRTGSGIVPTDVGRVYIERARDIVRMADELERAARSKDAVLSGLVTIGAGPYVAHTVLSRAVQACIAQNPNLSLRLLVRHWDDSLRQLRSRELDYFVAEVSTLQHETDLDISPMPTPHPLFFIARAGHPLATRAYATLTDTFDWPLIAPNRISPRLLEPILAAQRLAKNPAAASRPFPAVECGELATVKHIVEHSDATTVFTLPSVEPELDTGRLVVLPIDEPWICLHYGIVSLKGRPLTHAAQSFREFVVAAEACVVREEKRLLARWRPGSEAPARAERTRKTKER